MENLRIKFFSVEIEIRLYKVFFFQIRNVNIGKNNVISIENVKLIYM